MIKETMTEDELMIEISKNHDLSRCMIRESGKMESLRELMADLNGLVIQKARSPITESIRMETLQKVFELINIRIGISDVRYDDLKEKFYE